MSFDPFELFKRDPKMDERILASVVESNFFPAKGQHFRVRRATIADRSYMGDIFVCVESQDHCAVGKRVLDSYGGLKSDRNGEVILFVSGDVIFYDCTKIWEAILEDLATPPPPAVVIESAATDMASAS